MKDIQELAQQWLEWDKNASTHEEIQKLLQDGNDKELQERLEHRIAFGTAGLRGKMEAGFSRMNDLTVLQASQGLATYVSQHASNALERGIVIGYDHRHNSEDFANLTASAFLHKGFKVYLYHGICHTPMVPFGVKAKNAACGVMITASHNPKQDNGYKVYWENACQIIPPHDEGIAKAIEGNLTPWSWDKNIKAKTIDATKELHEAYYKAVLALSKTQRDNASTSVRFVYTAMHGVGYEPASRLFQAAGFKPFDAVAEQKNPDPEFPTVPFPNPEEKGALDLAMKHATAVGGHIVLANDPDADRFCAAERLPSGEWKVFSGNQIGTLLGARVLEAYKAAGRPIEKLAMLASTVSSTMLKAMAKKEGFHFDETLTGFKWLGNGAISLAEKGYNVEFAYEEAIGYMVGDIVRDKDGVSALLSFAELAVEIYKEGQTLTSYLDSLYQKYGTFVTNNSYIIAGDPALQKKIFDKVRADYPKQIGKYKIVRIRDLTTGYDSSTPDHKPILPSSASSQMITFELENGCIGTLRTSGTEPKIKYYTELSGRDEQQTSKELASIVSDMIEEWLEPQKNGLERSL